MKFTTMCAALALAFGASTSAQAVKSVTVQFTTSTKNISEAHFNHETGQTEIDRYTQSYSGQFTFNVEPGDNQLGHVYDEDFYSVAAFFDNGKGFSYEYPGGYEAYYLTADFLRAIDFSSTKTGVLATGRGVWTEYFDDVFGKPKSTKFNATVTVVGFNVNQTPSLSFVAEYGPAVPEPASWAMMIGGFGMVGGAMRRRQKAAVSFA